MWGSRAWSLVDPRTGTVLHAVNLGIDEVRLGDELAGSLGVPVSIENDVNAAALGAYRALPRNAPRPLRSLAFLNVGTGLAAGIVVGGVLLSGANGTAGEIGHIPVRSDGPRCRCGQTGCLEAIASGYAVATRWPSSAEHPVLELFRASRQGDPLAEILTSDIVDGIAAAIRMLVVAFDVERVVVGGGLTRGERGCRPRSSDGSAPGRATRPSSAPSTRRGASSSRRRSMLWPLSERPF